MSADAALSPEAMSEAQSGAHFGASVSFWQVRRRRRADYDGGMNQGKVYAFYEQDAFDYSILGCGGACDPYAGRGPNISSSTPTENEYFGKAVVLGTNGWWWACRALTNQAIAAGNIRTYGGAMAISDFNNATIGLYRAEELSGSTSHFGYKAFTI